MVTEHGNALIRDEHLDWSRKRALEYLDAGDLTHAVASMAFSKPIPERGG